MTLLQSVSFGPWSWAAAAGAPGRDGEAKPPACCFSMAANERRPLLSALIPFLLSPCQPLRERAVDTTLQDVIHNCQ